MASDTDWPHLLIESLTKPMNEHIRREQAMAAAFDAVFASLGDFTWHPLIDEPGAYSSVSITTLSGDSIAVPLKLYYYGSRRTPRLRLGASPSYVERSADSDPRIAKLAAWWEAS